MRPLGDCTLEEVRSVVLEYMPILLEITIDRVVTFRDSCIFGISQVCPHDTFGHEPIIVEQPQFIVNCTTLSVNSSGQQGVILGSF
jgi:hypothetical protein